MTGEVRTEILGRLPVEVRDEEDEEDEEEKEGRGIIGRHGDGGSMS